MLRATHVVRAQHRRIQALPSISAVTRRTTNRQFVNRLRSILTRQGGLRISWVAAAMANLRREGYSFAMRTPSTRTDSARRLRLTGFGASLFLMAAAGCVNNNAALFPDGYPQAWQVEERAAAAALQTETGTIPEAGTNELTLEPMLGDAERDLEQYREELDAIGPYDSSDRDNYELGSDLTGADQSEIALTLEDAIMAAIRNNLTLANAELQPAITQEDVNQAEAVFDWILYGSANTSRTDQPTTVTVINNIPLGTPFRHSHAHRFETGVRNRNPLGGELTVSTDLTHSNNKTPGLGLSPDPANTAAFRIGYSQPLLRGFGRDVNEASIRLAENASDRAVYDVRRQMLDLVADVETSYWNLVFAWHEMAISQWLVDQGETIRQQLEGRRDLDATPAELSDAVATVESRKADVIRARRALRSASDQLKLVINDPRMSVGSELLVRPTDEIMTEPISYSLREAIMTGVGNRPEIQQAASLIDDARIQQLVADNSRLPLLNLSAQLAYFGLDGDAGDAYEDLNQGDFIDYLVGLEFEWPFGNEAAEAAFRRARLQRTGTVLQYQQTIQNVVQDVKTALRDVIANYELISATRSFRIAQAMNLCTLRDAQTLRGMTPEYLNLRFQRQDTLAIARRQELQALVAYDQALAQFHRAMGISLELRGVAVEEGDSSD